MAGCSICKHESKGENEFPCCECVHNAKEHFEPYTNADRIRDMSDKEMARDLIDIIMEVCEDGVPTEEYFFAMAEIRSEGVRI